MSEIHDQIVEQFESYVNESEKFEGKGVNAAAARARKALGESDEILQEIVEVNPNADKKEDKPKKKDKEDEKF